MIDDEDMTYRPSFLSPSFVCSIITFISVFPENIDNKYLFPTNDSFLLHHNLCDIFINNVIIFYIIIVRNSHYRNYHIYLFQFRKMFCVFLAIIFYISLYCIFRIDIDHSLSLNLLFFFFFFFKPFFIQFYFLKKKIKIPLSNLIFFFFTQIQQLFFFALPLGGCFVSTSQVTITPIAFT